MRKMMEWTEEMISFMHDASDNSDYFVKLAEALSDYIPENSYVCDAGCGLGQLSVALSSFCGEIQGIDINPNAIRELNKSIEKSAVCNVSSLVADLTYYEPEKKFDLMIFNYFGSMEQIMKIKERCCKGPVLIVKRNYKTHRFSIGEKPITSFTSDSAVNFLQENKISFQELFFSHEFGQPFRNLQDAVSFFKLYSRDENPTIINLDSVRERLTETGDKTFPYYLKQNKESRILIVK